MVFASANKPYAPPPYKPAYPPKYDDVPVCAKNSSKPWCLSDYDYPLYDVQKALDQHYQTVLSLYKDVQVNTANSVDGLKNLIDETYLCPSSTGYIQPLRAVNVDGKWRVIVNKVESYNYVFTQTARIEECDILTAHWSQLAMNLNASRRAFSTVSWSSIPMTTTFPSPLKVSSSPPLAVVLLEPSSLKKKVNPDQLFKKGNCH